MNKEEKKAIERLKKFGDSISCADYPPEAYIDMKEDIEDLLYFIDKQQKEIEIYKETENDYEHEIARYEEEIDKQQKEIEELMQRNNSLTKALEEWINGERINDIKHISKDKIKEKIKELKEIMKAICEEEDCEDYQTEEFYKIQSLKDLLEV